MIIFSHFKHYLKVRFVPDLIALYSNRLILRIALGLLSLFTPIFLFEQFNFSIKAVLIFYLSIFIMNLFLVAPGAMFMSRTSLKNSMLWSLPFLLLYLISLYCFSSSPFIFAFLAIISIVFYRVLYWIPFNTNFAELSDPLQRGRQLALFQAVVSIISIFVPMAAGFIVAEFGFQVLFFLSIILTLVSMIPFVFMRRSSDEKFSFSYIQSFKELFKKANRRLLLAYGGDGAQSVAGFAVWPIFIYQILNGQYLSVGLISSVIIFITIILQLIFGDLSDRISKKKLVKLGSFLYSSGWFLKIFIDTGFQIFVIGTFHNFAAIVNRLPFDTLMYERAADQGHYVDEYTVLREMALSIGRIIMLIILIILFEFFNLSLPIAFLLAAIAALFINFL